MKKLLFAVLLLAAVPAWAGGPWIEWKTGTTVMQEYKALAGTIVFDQRLLPVLRAEGREYFLLVDATEPAALAWKNGGAIIVKGVASTVTVPGQAVLFTFRPFETTVGMKTFPFRSELDRLFLTETVALLADLPPREP